MKQKIIAMARASLLVLGIVAFSGCVADRYGYGNPGYGYGASSYGYGPSNYGYQPYAYSGSAPVYTPGYYSHEERPDWHAEHAYSHHEAESTAHHDHAVQHHDRDDDHR